MTATQVTIDHPYFDGAPSPTPISHAGDSDSGQHDGSRDAYELAYERGFRWFQVDVVAIGADQLASAHAVFGRRRAWERLTIDEISDRVGHDVALLADLLEAFDDVKFNIEVKSRRAEAGLIRLLDEADVIDRVCVSTPFHRGLSRRLRSRFGDRVCLAAPLLDGGLVGIALYPARRIRHDVCQVWLPLVRSRRVVQRALARGQRFQVWTVNSTEAVDRCLEFGVTGIITDRHELLRQHLIEHGRWNR